MYPHHLPSLDEYEVDDGVGHKEQQVDVVPIQELLVAEYDGIHHTEHIQYNYCRDYTDLEHGTHPIMCILHTLLRLGTEDASGGCVSTHEIHHEQVQQLGAAL